MTSATVIGMPVDRIVSCGDISCEFLIDPIPRPKPAPFTVTMRPQERHVTLVDNSKPNSLEILQMAQQMLRERGVTVTEKISRKASAGVPLHERRLAKFSEERGLLLLGIND